jgi:hypothetical protein
VPDYRFHFSTFAFKQKNPSTWEIHIYARQVGYMKSDTILKFYRFSIIENPFIRASSWIYAHLIIFNRTIRVPEKKKLFTSDLSRAGGTAYNNVLLYPLQLGSATNIKHTFLFPDSSQYLAGRGPLLSNKLYRCLYTDHSKLRSPFGRTPRKPDYKSRLLLQIFARIECWFRGF